MTHLDDRIVGQPMLEAKRELISFL